LFNFCERIRANPTHFKQLRAKDALITQYDCPLDSKFTDLWSQHNYIVHVIEGVKIWHTPQGSYELRKGDTVLVRKGASIVEQVFDSVFCLMVFFLPDEFILSALQRKQKALINHPYSSKLVIPIETSPVLESFFHSMTSYFSASTAPDPTLLETKFQELVLTIAEEPRNEALMSYFSSLLHEAPNLNLQKIMEENFSFNLKLEDYAQLCNRSLSAFKRDFISIYGMSPGKWLHEKRLQHARHLLINLKKNASDAAFESGFENVSHFSRAFKGYFGQSPMQLKTANLN
jgi:AraC family transcriptional regulator, exoenzyme S synthesis regulatory protein ExsA